MFTQTKFTTGEDCETQALGAVKAVLLLADFISIVNDRAREHDREMVEALWGIIDITYAAVASEVVEQHNLANPDDIYDGSIPVLNEFYGMTLDPFYKFSEEVLGPLTAAMPPTAPHPPDHQWSQASGLVVE